jgi:hypothetical protein
MRMAFHGFGHRGGVSVGPYRFFYLCNSIPARVSIRMLRVFDELASYRFLAYFFANKAYLRCWLATRLISRLTKNKLNTYTS